MDSIFCLIAFSIVSLVSTSPVTRHRRQADTCGCVTTTQYAPVCASDGVTYTNQARLDCAIMKCGASVTLAHPGACVTRFQNAQSNGTSSGTTSVATSTEQIPLEVPCNCVTTTQYAPVCGTDGNTYQNIASLRCQQQNCGRSDVRVNHRGACINRNPYPEQNANQPNWSRRNRN